MKFLMFFVEIPAASREVPADSREVTDVARKIPAVSREVTDMFKGVYDPAERDTCLQVFTHFGNIFPTYLFYPFYEASQL